MKNLMLNPDSEHVNLIIRGLQKKDGYCPCKVGFNPEDRCPCKEMIETEICHCRLFIKTEEDKDE